MVDNSIKVSKTQAEILKGFASNLTITQIAKWRKCSRQAVYKVISKLLELGLIEKIGYAYGLTDKGIKGLHSFMGLSNQIRQHNLSFKIKVLDSPKNWDKKRSQLTSLPYFNKRVSLKNTDYEMLNFGRIKVKTTSQSVILHIPTIYANTPEESFVEAMDVLYGAIPKIEALFKIKLVKDLKANIVIISQEYARLQDQIAKIYKVEDNKLYVTDEEGKIWLIADYSFAVNELETISPKRADEDMSIVHNFLNDLRKSPTTFSEVKDVIVEIVKVQQNDRQTMIHLNENLKTHFEVLNKIGKAVDNLADEVKKLRGEKQ